MKYFTENIECIWINILINHLSSKHLFHDRLFKKIYHETEVISLEDNELYQENCYNIS